VRLYGRQEEGGNSDGPHVSSERSQWCSGWGEMTEGRALVRTTRCLCSQQVRDQSREGENTPLAPGLPAPCTQDERSKKATGPTSE